MSDELAALDATAQAELVRSGRATPTELVDAAIARIEKLNPQLNAVIIPLFEKARRQAGSKELPEGPFRGVPLLLKDLVCQSEGDPYHAGMRLLKQRGWVAAADTFLAARFRAAGFVFVGRTNVPELGPMVTTEPKAYGATCNPWNLDHSTGGSSGGSAAAVAARLVPAAHANDGGGSIRIPASECGLVGLKPSRGRTSLGPEGAFSWNGMTAEHVVCRSVRDTAAILDAVAGPMPGDPWVAPPPARPFSEEVGADPGELRIGWTARPALEGTEVHPECVRAAAAAAHSLEALGHAVEEASPPELHRLGETLAGAWPIVSAWLARDLESWGQILGREIGPDDVEPHTWGLAQQGREASALDMIRAMETFERLSRRLESWWADGFDLLLTPTLPAPPPRLGAFEPTEADPLRGAKRVNEFVSFTVGFNVTGQPAISLPLHWSDDGLPVGVQLVAAPGREDVLIRVAAQLEQAHPWAQRTPRVCAG